MRIVEWEEDGYLCKAVVRDQDLDSDAPTKGLPLVAPLLADMDCEGFKRDLHNLLVKENATSYNDLMQRSQLVKHLVWVAVRPYLTSIYKP